MWYWKVTLWNGPPWTFLYETPFFQASVDQAQIELNNEWEDSGARVALLLYWWNGRWNKYAQLGPGADF